MMNEPPTRRTRDVSARHACTACVCRSEHSSASNDACTETLSGCRRDSPMVSVQCTRRARSVKRLRVRPGPCRLYTGTARRRNMTASCHRTPDRCHAASNPAPHGISCDMAFALWPHLQEVERTHRIGSSAYRAFMSSRTCSRALARVRHHPSGRGYCTPRYGCERGWSTPQPHLAPTAAAPSRQQRLRGQAGRSTWRGGASKSA